MNEKQPETVKPLTPAEYLLQFFNYKHLPPHLQAVSAPFAGLASKVAIGPQNAETTTAMRKLLEAKDCAVRAVLATQVPKLPDEYTRD